MGVMLFEVEEWGEFWGWDWDMDFKGVGMGRGEVGVVDEKELGLFGDGEFVDGGR